MRKRLILLVFLFFIPFNLRAEWEIIGTNTEGVKIYIDYENILNPKKDELYYWSLNDYPFPYSAVTLIQLDCKLMRTKIIQLTFYMGNMGQGEANYIDDSRLGKWKFLEPSFYFNGVKRICLNAN